MNKPIALSIALLIALIALAGAIMPPESEIQSMEANQYEEMVCIGRATNMDAGWPNYKNLEVTCE